MGRQLDNMRNISKHGSRTSLCAAYRHKWFDVGKNKKKQELKLNTTGDSKTQLLYLNAAPKSCQLANPPTPRNHKVDESTNYMLQHTKHRMQCRANRQRVDDEFLCR